MSLRFDDKYDWRFDRKHPLLGPLDGWFTSTEKRVKEGDVRFIRGRLFYCGRVREVLYLICPSDNFVVWHPVERFSSKDEERAAANVFKALL